VTGRHGAPQPTRWLKVTGEHAAILVAQGCDEWTARRRQLDRRCHAGEPRRGDLGEGRADRRAPSVSDGGTVTRGRPARVQRWAGVGAELGRPQRKRPTMIFSILNHFSK
jgi:hypothetical protein